MRFENTVPLRYLILDCHEGKVSSMSQHTHIHTLFNKSLYQYIIPTSSFYLQHGKKKKVILGPRTHIWKARSLTVHSPATDITHLFYHRCEYKCPYFPSKSTTHKSIVSCGAWSKHRSTELKVILVRLFWFDGSSKVKVVSNNISSTSSIINHKPKPAYSH